MLSVEGNLLGGRHRRKALDKRKVTYSWKTSVAQGRLSDAQVVELSRSWMVSHNSGEWVTELKRTTGDRHRVDSKHEADAIAS